VFTVTYDSKTIEAEAIKSKLRTEDAGPAGPYEVKEWTLQNTK
jgi:hypothetical protein